MKLWMSRHHWNRLASEDPYWAVLNKAADDDKPWNIDDFYSTGMDDVTADLDRLQALPQPLLRRRALDFGCGVGRLTQSLAVHFESVIGVDISKRMLATARRNNRHGTRVKYVYNSQTNLSVFPDNSFDLVYSRITLQHMEPAYMKLYLAEFVRVLVPNGVAVFQLPATLVEGDPWEHFKFSWWPPTFFMRAKRYCRYYRARFFPKIPMHSMPRGEVIACLTACGATVISTTRIPDQDVENYIYVAQKPPVTSVIFSNHDAFTLFAS